MQLILLQLNFRGLFSFHFNNLKIEIQQEQRLGISYIEEKIEKTLYFIFSIKFTVFLPVDEAHLFSRILSLNIKQANKHTLLAMC
ncbi:hypothetical protein SAMN05216323_102835 [Williamwhitmania taraxaci]|uniref:Uncharacterized protein n=1 Tax=Williamwhitmania taraxaci TaxID=1640674 RepID=A0A1G6L2P1_9BACT|nr:hypothetical protein SAMN05216323_102835 [Williamwhitmania taraxaci]